MFNRYSVSVGDNVWNSVYNYLRETYPSTSEEHNSIYRIAGIYEEEEQKFVVTTSAQKSLLQDSEETKIYSARAEAE